MNKSRFVVASAALIVVALLCLKVTGQQSEASPDALPEPAAASAMPQFVGELPKPQTDLEGAAIRTDALVTKGYQRIGEVAGDDGSVIRISAVEVAVGDAEKLRGLLVQVQQSHGMARSAVSYIDENEVGALITAVADLAKLQPQNNHLTDIDASFRTRGDLEVINVNNNGARTAGVRCTQLVRPTGQIVWATAALNIGRLEQLQHQLEAGRQALETLRNPEK
jgi:hypothetical protein